MPSSQLVISSNVYPVLGREFYESFFTAEKAVFIHLSYITVIGPMRHEDVKPESCPLGIFKKFRIE
jgi:hypothetical protein